MRIPHTFIFQVYKCQEELERRRKQVEQEEAERKRKEKQEDEERKRKVKDLDRTNGINVRHVLVRLSFIRHRQVEMFKFVSRYANREDIIVSDWIRKPASAFGCGIFEAVTQLQTIANKEPERTAFSLISSDDKYAPFKLIPGQLTDEVISEELLSKG
eukprot:NODE_850_length_3705_cov_0.234609.p2 type:complete len:158 gc:universal NODE_850_length_3705_cov_0.234609:516-989(+)